LIQNKTSPSRKKDGVQNLFSGVPMEISTKVYLLPEFKKADYFFKIENTESTMNALKNKNAFK
jgi:hypothetical protein